MRQALSDVVVVDLTAEPAGAYCAKTFADLGADVIKVEPPSGDPQRSRPGAFLHLNTNKRSVVVADDPAGRDRLVRLLGRADLVVQSVGHGDLAAHGFDVAEVRRRCPGLVVTTISGFGADGPYAGYRWSDLVVQLAGWSTLPLGHADVVP